MFYATELQHRVDNGDQVWAVVSLVVFGSILFHGTTATPLTRLYGRRLADRAEAIEA